MESRQRGPQSESTTSYSIQGDSGTRSHGVLVIGDDPVSNRLANHFTTHENIFFVGVGDSLFDSSEEHQKSSLEITGVTDLFEVDIEITPKTAIVATSDDSQNLLIVLHLQQKLEIEDIVVRVNDPQYIDAFADLSVELIDVASIVGAVLVERVDPSIDLE